MVNTFRKGAKVRYIGPDAKKRETWGDSVQTVMEKRGDRVYGYFPAKWYDGSIHALDYSVSIYELEVVG